MQKLHYTATINAPAKKVWDTMLEDATYRKWTAPFGPGCYAEGDWSKGSRMRFLARNEEGKLEGMIADIAENKPYEFLSIKHIGMMKDGNEDLESEQIQTWKDAFENYTLKEANGVTELQIDLNVDDAFADMFNDMWPKALHILKELCEV
jgi:uncharacterized protein YndB with AHSA1/START domain